MRPTAAHRSRPARRTAVRAGVVAAATVLVAAGAGTAQAAPSVPGGGPDGIRLSADQLRTVQEQLAAQGTPGRPAGLPASGPASFFLQVGMPATAEVYADALPQGRARAAEAARSAKPAVTAAAGRVVAELPASVPGADVLYTTSAVLPGVAVAADASDYAALTQLPGVTAVHAITPKKVDNTGAAAVVGAVQAWQQLGNTGRGVRVGIIDTGIDYTHADFGGSGDVAQFQAALAAEKELPAEGVFPNAKVVGGRDFVGNAYNADPMSPDFDPVAVEDPNPLDCNGHGTHVAGTAAGYGVSADGSTYRGGYGEDFTPSALRIGPGMAPEASLYALKIFGCEGSTEATIRALEWALDPDGDGSIEDHLDVVNLSLGSDYGVADDADALAADAAAEAGMLVVMAAGNAGDSYDIGGSPGNAPHGIGVAASNDGYGVFDGWRVTSGGGPAGVRPGLRSQSYTGPPADITAPVVLPAAGDDPSGCTPFSGDYAGRIVVLQAAGFACGSAVKGATAAAAGAAGFLIVGDNDLLETGIAGVAQIPGILVTRTDGTALSAAVAAGAVTVTFGNALKDAAVVDDPSQVDLLGSFSSRGTRQAGDLKPDLAAPGVTLYSAAVGTGSQGVSFSGTSMATPTTAGVTALVRAAHPDWTAEEVKADLMNTAGHDVHTETGTVFGPNRQGAGRIDARAALTNTVLAYAGAGSGVVSASFGVVEVAEPQVVDTRSITLANKGDEPVTYRAAYEALAAQPGVSYDVSPGTVTVPAGGRAEVTVTMTAVRDQLRKVGDPTVDTTRGQQFLGEASGRVVLTGGPQPLRVPVHSNAKPSSTLTAESDTGGTVITLAGQGVANGDPAEPTSYVSRASALEQLGTSPAMERCTGLGLPTCYKSELERSVDVATVGVASDVRSSPQDPWIFFGVAAHGRFTSAQTAVNYGVYLDATGDGRWDYQVTTIRAPGLDVPLVVVTDRGRNLLPDPAAPWIGFLNLAAGNVDTNVFDSDVQVLGAPLSVMPLIGAPPAGGGAATGRIGFGVQSVSAYGTVDEVGTIGGAPAAVELAEQPMSFDALDPGLSFTVDGAPAVMVPATGGTRIAVAQDPEAYDADVAVGETKGAMVVFQHNDTATGRTRSVPVPVLATAG